MEPTGESSTPQTANLVPPPSPPRSANSANFPWKVVGLVVVALIVVSGVVVYFVPEIRVNAVRMWTALTLAPELEQFYMLPAPDSHEGWVMYKKEGIDFVPQGTASHSLVPAARAPGHIVEVEGVAISLDGESLHTAASAPQQIAISPMGDYVAFVLTPLRELPQNTTPESLDTLLRTYVGSSHIYLLSVKEKEPQDLGIGYSPVFIDDTHLLRLTPEGMAVTDLTTGVTTSVFTGSFNTFRPLITSLDAAHVAFQASDKTVYVYAVNATIATEVIKITSPKGAPAGLTSDSLYTIAVSANGSDVWVYSLADGSERRVQHFPASFKIVKLIP